MAKEILIGNHKVGKGHPCYIIAEMSCNHEGDFDEACDIIKAAAEAGADAIKIQTYTADTMTRDFKDTCGDTMWGELDLYKLYDEAHTPWDWHAKLADVASKYNIDLFSSPFDETAVDFLMEQNVPVFKIASFEIVDNKLLEKVASTGKPVIFSNGMTTFQEIQEAYFVLKGAGCEDIAILHCNSGYPPPFEVANLRTISVMDDIFDCPIGLSDHTLFADVENKAHPMAHICPLEAVKLGAKIIEVHLTLDRDKSKALFEQDKGGYDWAFSRDPAELKYMIDMIRAYERGDKVSYDSALEKEMAKKALGVPCFEPTDAEKASREYRPVLWCVQDIQLGEELKFAGGKTGNFDSIRGHNKGEKGLHIRYADFINNQKAMRDIKAGEVLTWDMIEI